MASPWPSIPRLHTSQFSVAVIPETVRNTTLKTIGVGDTVNIEIDVICKTVRRYLDTMLSESGTLTLTKGGKRLRGFLVLELIGISQPNPTSAPSSHGECQGGGRSGI